MQTPHSLLKIFGHSHFKPRQQEAIEALLAGQDVLLVSATGSGKSLVYQMASLMLEGVGVIVSPLLSLMSQQVNYLKSLGIRAECLNSSLNPGEQDDLVWALRHQQVDIVFLSPEKLIQANVIGLLSHLKIALFAIDEAHCITQWGAGFRPEYGQLGRIRDTFPQAPIIAMTGTVDANTTQAIIASLKLNRVTHLIESFNRANIELIISQKKQSIRQLLYFLQHEVPGHKGIIYCRSRNKVTQLSAQLNQLGWQTRAYHAAMSDAEKNQNAQFFYQTSGVIMVATTAFGMGIDLANVRFVVHMDLPSSIEAYYQEIGRAGRDGLPAKALLLYGLQDMLQLRQFVSEENSGTSSGVEQQRMLELFQFLERRGCRRQALLAHFGEQIQACGNCDRCLHLRREQDASLAAQKLLSLIYHTKGRVNLATMIQILHGKQTKSVLALQGQYLSLFAKGVELTEGMWKAVFRQLWAENCIELIGSDLTYQLSMTEVARAVLKSQKAIYLTADYHAPLLKNDSVFAQGSQWQQVQQWYKSQEAIQMSQSSLQKIVDAQPKTLASLSRLTGLSLQQLEQGDAMALLTLLTEGNHRTPHYCQE